MGVADIVNSTDAIQADRYKTVNMAGAAVIAAVKNALGGRDFPYVFGGDGASFAVAPGDLARAAEALAATARWVGEDLDLAMRTALVPVAAIRAAGLDVTVARFAPSANISFAMFAGGGLAWADAAMRRGEFAATAAPPGARPDLTGLTCSFDQMASVRGVILSLIIAPAAGAEPSRVSRRDRGGGGAGRGQSGDGDAGAPGRSADALAAAGDGLEARARGARWPLAVRRILVLARTLLAYPILRFGISVGTFDARGLHPPGGGELRFPEIRRWAADDAGLHAGAGRCARRAAGGGGIARDHPLRHAPADRGADDLFLAVADGDHACPFHRRCEWGIRGGGGRAEGDGGVITGGAKAARVAGPVPRRTGSRRHEDPRRRGPQGRQAAQPGDRRSRRPARGRGAGGDQGHRHLPHRRIHAVRRRSRGPVSRDPRP